MIEAGEVRKTISFTYDTDTVKGKHATVSAQNPADGTELEEKKEIENDGTLALAFPMDYEGECYIEVHGSSGGMDSGTVTV